MLSKSEYRIYFVNVSKYVKMKHILKDVRYPTSNFSKFLKNNSYDHYASLEKLEQIKERLLEVFDMFT